MKKMLQKFSQLLLLGITCTGSSQVIFQQGVNHQALGAYTLDEVKSDFSTSSANGFIRKGVGEDRVSIVNTGSTSPSGKCMKVKYPRGKVDTKDSGANWETNLGANQQQLYMSYYVKFNSGFNFNTKIGKLPGLGGGLNFNDGDDKNTHFHGKLMWRANGQLQFYLKQPTSNLKEYNWSASAKLKTNVWQHIQIRYKLNTIVNGKPVANGEMEAWLNNVQVSIYKNIIFRKNAGVGINSMVFSTFFGGNVAHDAPTRDEYAYFDDIKVSKTKIAYSAPSSSREITSDENDVITKDETTNAISIYPNPTTVDFINVSGINEEKSEVVIYNELGAKVFSQFLDENNTQINVSNLSTGFYILRIIDSEGERFKKFSKQ